MTRYYCSGFDVNDVFGHGLGEMIKTELNNTNSIVYIVGDPKKEKKIEKAKNILIPSFTESFEKNGIHFEKSEIILPDTNPETAKKLIDEANFLMLMGGNPYDQKEMCENLDIIDNIKNFKGVMMGYSAGAMLMSKYIIITPCSEEYPDFHIGEGLNFDDISIFPHNNISSEEYPEKLDLGKEMYIRDDLIKVAQQYGDYYLLQDYTEDGQTFDISLIKSTDGNIEYYTENNGKIWLAKTNGIEMINKSNKKIK